MRIGISSWVLLAACAVVAVFGAPPEKSHAAVQTDAEGVAADYISQMRTANTITGGVATILGSTSKIFPALTVFTSLFAFMNGLMNTDEVLWRRLEAKMKEIAQEAVSDYHKVMTRAFIDKIKRSTKLFSDYSAWTTDPKTRKTKKNDIKINAGLTLSEIINNSPLGFNTEVKGSNPQTMVLYYMEMASIDIAVLFHLAITYGRLETALWTTLKTRLGYHISDATAAAQKIVDWRTSSKFIKCERSGNGYKGTDMITDICRTERYQTKCGARGCVKTRRKCEKFSMTRAGVRNCDFFRTVVNQRYMMPWINANVMDAVREWQVLKDRKLLFVTPGRK